MFRRSRVFGVLVATALLAGSAVVVGAGSEARAPLKHRALLASVADGTTAGSGLLAAADGLHAFGPIGLVDAEDAGGEPGIDVAPDGSVYVNAPSGLGGATGSFAYRSTDGGATWSKCGSTSGPGGGDSTVAITPAGKIAMNDLWLGSLTFYVSDDRCASWTAIPVSTPVPVGDRQWLDWGPGACEFFQSWNQIPTGIRVQRTTNCGLTWTDTAAASSVDLIGNLVVDHAASPARVYQVYSEGGAIRVAIGTVRGTLLGESLSFTPRTVAPAIAGHDTMQSFPAGAVDAAGNVHVVWQDLAGGVSRILYAYSADRGESWSAPREISTGGSNVFPWIDAGAAGKVNAAWYHADAPGDPNAVSGPWFVDLGQALTLGGEWSVSRATAVSIHNDVICTGGTSCGGDDRDLADFFELAHDAAGLAVIAFAKDTDAAGAGNGSPRNAFVRQTSGPGIA